MPVSLARAQRDRRAQAATPAHADQVEALRRAQDVRLVRTGQRRRGAAGCAHLEVTWPGGSLSRPRESEAEREDADEREAGAGELHTNIEHDHAASVAALKRTLLLRVREVLGGLQAVRVAEGAESVRNLVVVARAADELAPCACGHRIRHGRGVRGEDD